MDSGRVKAVDARAFGYPFAKLTDIPAGRYRVQALLNRYETFRRSDGKVVKLPPDKGEGQQWNRKPGNIYSAPRWIHFDPDRSDSSISPWIRRSRRSRRHPNEVRQARADSIQRAITLLGQAGISRCSRHPSGRLRGFTS